MELAILSFHSMSKGSKLVKGTVWITALYEEHTIIQNKCHLISHVIFWELQKNQTANKEHYFAKYATNLFELKVETSCLDGNYWCNCMKKQGFKQVVKNLTQDTTYQQDSFSNF